VKQLPSEQILEARKLLECWSYLIPNLNVKAGYRLAFKELARNTHEFLTQAMEESGGGLKP